jgi:hypothetical protein
VLDGRVKCTGDMTNTHKVLVGKPEGKRPPFRITRRREDNIKM